MQKIFKNYFLIGLLTAAPLFLTVWVLWAIIQGIDQWIYKFIPGSTNSTDLFGVYLPGLGILMTVGIILAVGFIANTFFGKVLNQLLEKIIYKIPLAKGFYKSFKQVGEVFFATGDKPNFKRVVWVPGLCPQSKVLGFVTGEDLKGGIFVFVPTAPNPTGGYVFLFPPSAVEEASYGVDEALQFVISCGFAKK